MTVCSVGGQEEGRGEEEGGGRSGGGKRRGGRREEGGGRRGGEEGGVEEGRGEEGGGRREEGGGRREEGGGRREERRREEERRGQGQRGEGGEEGRVTMCGTTYIALLNAAQLAEWNAHSGASWTEFWFCKTLIEYSLTDRTVHWVMLHNVSLHGEETSVEGRG